MRLSDWWRRMALKLTCDSCGKTMGNLEEHYIRNEKYICKKCNANTPDENTGGGSPPYGGIILPGGFVALEKDGSIAIVAEDNGDVSIMGRVDQKIVTSYSGNNLRTFSLTVQYNHSLNSYQFTWN